MTRKFATAYELISWAKGDIRELKECANGFFASDVYERFSEPDTDGVYVLDKIRITRPLPTPITRLTVDSIAHLRSALDHGACAVVPIRFRKNTSFPFGDTKREFDGHLKSKCKYVPDEIRTLFSSFKPYKRGNPPLWALNKICNTHKHRTIVEPGVSIKSVQLSDPPFTSLSRYVRPKWNRRKNEIIISRGTHQGTSHHDVDASLGVAFGKVQTFSGMPALAVLRYLTRIVESIVMATEAEARRIGLV